jgi:Skp family chaperone for outer membrane proteins
LQRSPEEIIVLQKPQDMQNVLAHLHDLRTRSDINAARMAYVDCEAVDRETMEDSPFLARLFDIYYPAHQKRRHLDRSTIFRDHRPQIARQVISAAKALSEIEALRQDVPDVTQRLSDSVLQDLHRFSAQRGSMFLDDLERRVKFLAEEKRLREDADTIASEAVRLATKSVQEENEYAKELQEAFEQAQQTGNLAAMAAIRRDVHQMYYLISMSSNYSEVLAKHAQIYLEAALAFLLLPSVAPQ